MDKQKIEEIVKNYDGTMPKTSIKYLLEEISSAIAAAGGGGDPGYLEYVAFVQWSGNAEPPATVHEHSNTLGGTPVWSRDQAGAYALTLAGAFPYAKTYIQCPRVFWSSDLAAFYSLNVVTNQADDNAINFLFYDTEDNSIEAGAHIMLEIRVYP